MAEVRVKAGQEHFGTKDGVVHRYGPGATMEVPEKQLKAFLKALGDKFEVVGAEPEEEEEEELDAPVEFDVKTADKSALMAKAEEIGLEVDSRWGEKRLREEVSAVLGE